MPMRLPRSALRLGQGQQVVALEQDGAGHRRHHGLRQQAHDGVGDHGLAGAAFAHDAQRFAATDAQAGVLDRERAVGAGRKADRQAADVEQGVPGWRGGGMGGDEVHARLLGSMRVFSPSLRPSPIRFSASTVSRMATPGNRLIHQAWRSAVRAAPIM